MLLSTWSILGLNLILHQGWLGGLGQIIGGDFIMFYATGKLYQMDSQQIYNYDRQLNLQQSLIEPTQLPGLNPYMNPPYVAMIYSMLTVLPLPYSLMIWSTLSIIFTIIAVRQLIVLVPDWLKKSGLTFWQLFIVVLSFFPFIEGFQAGQNHALTLLLITSIVVCTIFNRWLPAGICAGLLLYKPQLIIGFLIIWLVWRQVKTLITFGIVATLWISSYILVNGTAQFHIYSDLVQMFLQLPYVDGFPAYLQVTVYGFLTTVLPQTFWLYIYRFEQLLMILFACGLAWMAYKHRHPSSSRIPVISLALLFPLIASPYSLLHDLLILIPGFILWLKYVPSRSLLSAAIVIYFGTFILTFIGAISGLALPALLVLGLLFILMHWIIRNKPWMNSVQITDNI